MLVMDLNRPVVEPDVSSNSTVAAESRWTIFAAFIAAALIIAATWQATIRISHLLIINHVAGAWTTLATDLASGTFYRPTVSPEGFGGTRFAPLYIVLQAGLIKLGVPPLNAGLTLSVIAMFALALGVMFWVRRLGASAMLTIAAGGTMFATDAVRALISDIRGDALAAALCVWALALWQRDRQGRHARWWIVALLLALAWTTKLTTVYGIAAIGLVSLVDGRKKQGVMIGVAAVVLTLSFYGLAQLASHGRMFRVFAECADGGAGFKSLLRSPLTFLYTLRTSDPIGLALFMITIPVLAMLLHRSGARRNWRGFDLAFLLPSLTIIFALGLTFFIFASPGTSLNHMLDLQAVSLVGLIAAGLVRPKYLAIGLIMFCLVGLGTIWMQDDLHQRNNKKEMARLVTAIGPGEKPILSENPSVLLATNERVYMLDAFMLRLETKRDSRIMDRVKSELSSQAYRGVILMEDPRSPEGVAAIERTHFYPGFCADLLKSYEVVEPVGKHNVALKPIRVKPQ